jgi:hypothetical protein
MLMNLPCGPAPMMPADVYTRNLQGIALAWAIPLFDRFAIMKQWGDGCLCAVREKSTARSAIALKARDIHCAENTHSILESGGLKPAGPRVAAFDPGICRDNWGCHLGQYMI